MSDENTKKEESEKENASDEKTEGSPTKEEDPDVKKESNEEPMEVSEEGGHTPPNTDSNDVSSSRSPTTEESKGRNIIFLAFLFLECQLYFIEFS